MRVLLATMILSAVLWTRPSYGFDAAWQALRGGGTVALLRHARAPGTGDPAGFLLDDCSSQRNLSEEGRRQSREIGAQFRAQGVTVERILSSRWCRSLETARLAFGSKVELYPPLDSFFSTRKQSERQTEEVRRLIANWRSSGALVLVTHQVNITALTGVFPAEGEILVLRPRAGGFDLIDRIRP